MMTQNETGGGIPSSEVPADAAASDMAELKLNMRTDRQLKPGRLALRAA